MARFYFDVRDGDELIRDPQVYHFATAQQARDAAVHIMRELIAEHCEDFDGKQVEIADAATGHPLAVVSLHDVMPVRSYH